MKLRPPVHGKGYVYLQVGCEFGVRKFRLFVCVCVKCLNILHICVKGVTHCIP